MELDLSQHFCPNPDCKHYGQKGLWNITEQTYSCLSMNDIMDMDFEEKIEYVDFQTAMKHMVKGGKAQFSCMARMEFRDNKLGYLMTTSKEWKDAVLYKEMITEKEWALL